MLLIDYIDQLIKQYGRNQANNILATMLLSQPKHEDLVKLLREFLREETK